MKAISQSIARKNGHGALRLNSLKPPMKSRATAAPISPYYPPRSILTALTLHPDIATGSGRPNS